MNELEDQIQALESLRSSIQIWEDTASWLGGYLDHGNPSPEEEHEALADIARYDRQVAEAKPRFGALVARLRAEAPAAVDAWVAAHQAVCRRFIDEGLAERLDPEIGLFVAGELLAEWEKVREGLEDYVHVGDTILLGYGEYLTAALAASGPEGAAQA